MKKGYFLTIFLISMFAWADDDHHKSHTMEMEAHSHEGHKHEVMVDGRKLEVDPDRFDKFVDGQKNFHVAVISVNGMVCDFCARGISKTFKKDENVKKISIDLKNGKVVIAYQNDYKISFDDIKEKMLENGINAVKMEIINI